MKKILLICEKTYHIELLKSILNANSIIFTDEYYFDICNPIRHLDDNSISEEFLNNMKPLELQCLTIPKNTFFEVIVQNKYQDLHCFDKIISLCDYDNCGKLAFAKYLENHHVLFKNTEILPLTGLTDKAIDCILQSKSINFQDVMNDLELHLKESNFSSEYNIREKSRKI